MEWLGELTELHRAGVLSDEDFAYQRAERLDKLIETPRRLWLGWIRLGAPLAGAAGIAAWWWTNDIFMLAGAAVLVVLCMFAALSRLSRECVAHLTLQERSDILYDLLGQDLISSEEFLAFDERLTGRTSKG
jgi:hypothetical protein